MEKLVNDSGFAILVKRKRDHIMIKKKYTENPLNYVVVFQTMTSAPNLKSYHSVNMYSRFRTHFVGKEKLIHTLQ